MAQLTKLKSEVCEAIEKNKGEIISLAKEIQEEPELGFKEVNTSKKVAKKLEELELQVTDGLALTGVEAYIPGGEEKANIAVLGELDALINRDHPHADPETGAVHACGHQAQIANLIGVAYGFCTTDVSMELLGSITLVAVPAEEYVDLDYRRGLIKEGKIKYFSGKQELIRKGYFDDITGALMVHAANNPDRTVRSRISMNGFLGKFVTYRGRSAHAGAEPEKGVNALNAANIGLNAINARRETFKDEDVIRVHPIVTKGGDGVNVVPSDVKIKTYVRARNIKALLETNEKVNKALKGGALAIGTDVKISDYPGYLPFESNELMAEVYDKNTKEVLGQEGVTEGNPHVTASTDLGDVSQFVPSLEASIGGFRGNVHSREFRVVDDEMAFVEPAKITARTIIDILGNRSHLDTLLETRRSKEDKAKYLNTLERMRGETEAKFMS